MVVGIERDVYILKIVFGRDDFIYKDKGRLELFFVKNSILFVFNIIRILYKYYNIK